MTAANGPATRQRPGPWSHLDERRDMGHFRPIAERFWEKVDKTETCWLWTAGVNPSGYGQFNDHTRTPIAAHRQSWLMAYGAVPDDLCVLHSCDVRACVRPDHLFLGTRPDNSADMVAKNRSMVGARHPMSKANEAMVRSIRALYDHGATQQAIADYYGISRSAVGLIVTRKRWPHVI
jgi:hypothetical protein